MDPLQAESQRDCSQTAMHRTPNVHMLFPLERDNKSPATRMITVLTQINPLHSTLTAEHQHMLTNAGTIDTQNTNQTLGSGLFTRSAPLQYQIGPNATQSRARYRWYWNMPETCPSQANDAAACQASGLGPASSYFMCLPAMCLSSIALW